MDLPGDASVNVSGKPSEAVLPDVDNLDLVNMPATFDYEGDETSFLQIFKIKYLYELPKNTTTECIVYNKLYENHFIYATNFKKANGIQIRPIIKQTIAFITAWHQGLPPGEVGPQLSVLSCLTVTAVLPRV